ncbi:MAG: N-acetylmannosamine-6-phosphate 2-epimerase [Tissierellia bacterium]|nr:N-acetylmannosamine-6-phosphate 2-epimerase [Tissierellia bacterium]
MDNETVKGHIKNGIIISCQALEDEPMYSENGGVMPLFAKAAQQAGAKGIRANTVRDILEIKEVVDLPMIGIIKKVYGDCKVFITPTMKEIDELVKTGVEIIAMDATLRQRPDGKSIDQVFRQAKEKYPDQLFMADCSTFEDAMNAAKLGFDFIGTTLNGYTDETMDEEKPNFALVEKIVKNTYVPVIAEGSIIQPEQGRKMLESGAYSFVVGGAITRPLQIAQRFVNEIKSFS